MQFKIDLKIFVFFVLFFFTKQVETYSIIMLFAVIHELGHLVVGLLLKMKPKKFEIMPFGVRIAFSINPNDYNKKINKANFLELKKIIVALAGPLTNLILLIIFLNVDKDIFKKLILVYSNLLLILFNLLPIYPLDGGRILKGILHIVFGKQSAERYINNISFISIIILTLLSCIAFYLSKNIAIFMIIVYLWIVFIKQEIYFKRKDKIYKLLKKTIEIR